MSMHGIPLLVYAGKDAPNATPIKASEKPW